MSKTVSRESRDEEYFAVRKCKNPKCNKEFKPNPRNRTKKPQVYCTPHCRFEHWNDMNPRIRATEKVTGVAYA